MHAPVRYHLAVTAPPQADWVGNAANAVIIYR